METNEDVQKEGRKGVRAGDRESAQTQPDFSTQNTSVPRASLPIQLSSNFHSNM